MSLIKSPLRYPGGKSRALEQIVAHLPEAFSEYREPMVGGGSLFIYLRQQHPHLKVWINDLNTELYCFWKQAQDDLPKLVGEISRIKQVSVDGKKLFHSFAAQTDALSEMERAVRFFVLNRITFSGTVDSGGYSQKAFETRFTDSSIERLAQLETVLRGVEITNVDYRQVLGGSGSGVLLFLDPPYLSASASRLYGRKGTLHTSFNHAAFAAALKQCSHNWLITYDDSPEIRANFSTAHLHEWELQYGMNNYKQKTAAKGKELFITNYAMKPVSVQSQLTFFH